MKRKIHFRFRRRPLCGIRASGQHYSRQITTASSERAVTCKNCRRLLKQCFVYPGFALFDDRGELLWHSPGGSRTFVREWALKEYEGRTWGEMLKLGYRIESVLLQRV